MKRRSPRSVFHVESGIGIRENGAGGIEVIGLNVEPGIVNPLSHVLGLWKYGMSPIRNNRSKKRSR